MTPRQLVTYKGRKWSVTDISGPYVTLVEQKPFWPFPGATIVVHSRDLRDNAKANLNTLEDAPL